MSVFRWLWIIHSDIRHFPDNPIFWNRLFKPFHDGCVQQLFSVLFLTVISLTRDTYYLPAGYAAGVGHFRPCDPAVTGLSRAGVLHQIVVFSTREAVCDTVEFTSASNGLI